MVEFVKIDYLYKELYTWTSEVGYGMRLKDGETLYDNFSVLRDMIECLLQYFSRKMLRTEAHVFVWIFNEEFNGRAKLSKCFFVDSEHLDYYFNIIEHTIEDNLAENKTEPSEQLWNIEDARSYLLEKFGTYSNSFHEHMLKYISSRNDIENIKFLCDLAQGMVKFLYEVAQTPNLFDGVKSEESEKKRKERKIYLRILCEAKKDDREEWHLFNEDVINAIECVLLDDENDLRREKLEKWRKSGSIITVKCLETMLDILNLPKSRFKLVQDIEITRNLAELPLTMGYCAMKVISPDGNLVYHQIQAQFLLFQFAVCDIYWPKSHIKSEEHEKLKRKIIEEMRNIKKGYISAIEIEEIIEQFKYSKLAQKTGLASLHGVFFQFNTKIPKKVVEIYLKSIGMPKSKEIKYFKELNIAVFLKYTLMMLNIQRFFDQEEDFDLKKNIMKAWSLGLVGNFDLAYWMNSPFSMEFYDWSKYTVQMEKNRPELPKDHYFFHFDDPHGKRMQCKEMRTDCSAEHMSFVKTFRKNLTKVLAQMREDDDFQPFDVFFENFFECFGGFGTGISARHNRDVLEKIIPFLQRETKEFLDFANIDGIWYCKKKRTEKNEEKNSKSPRKHEKEQIEVVIETKIEETCKKCTEIQWENEAFSRKIEVLERNRTCMKMSIEEREKDLQILNLQVERNKLNYEEIIENHRKHVENREMKIKQVENEMEQYLEDWKNEKMKLLIEMGKSRRKENEEVEKMKKRLENAKFSDRNMNRIIEELEKENNQLKVRIEIAKENL